MAAEPTPENLTPKIGAGFVGSTPAERPNSGPPNGVDNPGENSIQKAREDRDAASGYAALREEVVAIEAKVTGSTTAPRKAEVVALRNKVERPALKEDGNNDINSPVVRKAQVDAVRAVAQALAAKSF